MNEPSSDDERNPFNPGYFHSSGQSENSNQKEKAPWREKADEAIFFVIAAPIMIMGVALQAALFIYLMWGLHVVVYSHHANRFGEFMDGKMGHPILSLVFLLPLLFAAFPLSIFAVHIAVRKVLPARRIFERTHGQVGPRDRDELRSSLNVSWKIIVICLMPSTLASLLSFGP